MPKNIFLLLLFAVVFAMINIFLSISPNNFGSEAANRNDFSAPSVHIFESKESKNAFNESVWNKIKNKMCPNMKPNHNVWSALFELGRIELGLPSSGEHPHQDRKFTRAFFSAFEGVNGCRSPNEKNLVVYLNIWKAAHNTIGLNLVETLCNKVGWLKTDHKARPSAWTHIANSHLRNHSTCLVTAVRDPISHFLSGYNEVEFRVAMRDQGHFWPKSIPFTFHENGTEARFEQFMADFIGGAGSSGIHPSQPEYNLHHVYSMTGVLTKLKEQSLSLTAYLPSLKNLYEEFPKFLTKNCKRLPPGSGDRWAVPYPHRSQNLTLNKFGFYDAAKLVWKKQGATSRALCAIHALDYACFDEVPIPSLCKSVYSQQDFLDRVLKVPTASAAPHPPHRKQFRTESNWKRFGSESQRKRLGLYRKRLRNE